MAQYSIQELKNKMPDVVRAYNSSVSREEQISRVSLFGSYANGMETEKSDIDLLVKFTSAVVSLFTLAKVLSFMEDSLQISVDVVQDPVPKDSLLLIEKVIPLYE